MNLENVQSGSSEELEWITTFSDVSLERNKIHVWRCSLEQNPDQINLLEATLSESELKRANRYHFDHGRIHFIVSRGVLRTILGYYLNMKPEDICFQYGRNGKPSLSGGINSRICFNVSHSHNTALYAFTYDRKIGVDIEHIDRDRTFKDIAERFFTAREVSAIKSIPEGKQRKEFFNYWTCKEAYLKALGTGLSFGLDKVEIDFAAGENSVLVGINGDANEAASWSIKVLNVASEYSAALAVQGPDIDTKYWQWGNGPA